MLTFFVSNVIFTRMLRIGVLIVLSMMSFGMPAQAGLLEKWFGCKCSFGSKCEISDALKIKDEGKQAEAIEVVIKSASAKNDLGPIKDLLFKFLNDEKFSEQNMGSITSWLHDFFLTGDIGKKLPKANAVGMLEKLILDLSDEFPNNVKPQRIEMLANAMGKVGVGSDKHLKQLINLAGSQNESSLQKLAQLTLIATLRNRYYVLANHDIGTMSSSVWSRFFFSGDPSGFRGPTSSELDLFYSAAKVFLKVDQHDTTQTTGAVLIAYLKDLYYPVQTNEVLTNEILSILVRNALGRNQISFYPFVNDFEFAQTILLGEK
jgi:hypothetical protein